MRVWLIAGMGALALATSCATTPPPSASPPPEAIEISLERGSCLNACPEYAITINGDGEVLYEGRRNVRERGAERGQISREQVMSLVSMFGRAGFFTLRPAYGRGTVDAQTVSLTLVAGSRRQTVANTGGLGAGPAPASLAEIAAEIDRVTNSAQWIARPTSSDEPHRRSLPPSGTRGGG